MMEIIEYRRRDRWLIDEMRIPPRVRWIGRTLLTPRIAPLDKHLNLITSLIHH
jgi:hypothetical protein